jgi:outer membrane lipoprotein-sorting protein
MRIDHIYLKTALKSASIPRRCSIKPNLIRVFFTLMIVLLPMSIAAKTKDRSIENRILAVAQKMASAFQSLGDYTCDVETIFYRGGQHGTGYERYRFKFYFKRNKKIRVDFSEPYPGTIVIYNEGKEGATVIPFGFMPGLKFNLSLKNPMVKTPSGQRLDQTDMGYFIDFVFRSLKKIEQKDGELGEESEKITFSLNALDHINREKLEKYRIVISKKNWLPIGIERYKLDGTPVESMRIRNYSINTQLDDHLFHPWDRQ